MAALQDQSLTDQKDADYAALQPAYRIVTLTNLDGSGYLRGDWANIRSETGPAAYSPDNSFLYGRDDDRFEQVMAYYWVTEAQLYIQSLGFGSTLRPINMESQDIRINQYGIDNSYSWDKHDVMRFGKGGVDDAEDAEVILHEYGHAMMDSQVAALGGSVYAGESGGISEGFSRLLGGDRQQRRRPHAGPGLRRRLGRRLLHLDRAALPAARRPEPALPRGPHRLRPPRRPDLVAGAVGHPRRAGPRHRPTPSSWSRTSPSRRTPPCRRPPRRR